MNLYAIGDIHGCLNALQEMIEIIKRDANGLPSKVIFVGDYVDRGPHSADVIQYLIDLTKEDSNIEYVFLKGNHDVWLMDWLNDKLHFGDAQNWHYNGGKETIQSYENGEFDKNLHRDWLNDNIKLFHTEGEFVFVHAGIPPDHPINGLDNLDEYYLLWSRDWQKYNGLYENNVFVIHGHTPVENPLILNNQMDIDTGCVFGKHYSEYGKLTAVKIHSRDNFEFFHTREYPLKS